MSADHYENFPVASWLCPAALRPAVQALYAYARTADDLADEGEAPPAERLAALAAYRHDLARTLDGQPASGRWPGLFEALGQAVATHDLPADALHHLLDAFEQDVRVDRHPDRAALLHYCARSANPVGRLMLRLYRRDEAWHRARSDEICTALQLINFWQDVGVDARRGRVYLPESDARAHGFDAEALLAAGRARGPSVEALVSGDGRAASGANAGSPPAGLPAALAAVGAWADDLMRSGAPLAHAVPGRAGWELRGIVQGGLRVLDRLQAQGWQSFDHRPRLRRRDGPVILWRMWRMSPHRPLPTRLDPAPGALPR